MEVDFWVINNGLYLGHDDPYYKISNVELLPLIWMAWFHCKNVEAIDYCFNHGLNGFWHEEDKYTVTVHGFTWTYRGYILGKRSIAVLPELMPEWDISNAWGICTDFPEKYKEMYGKA